MPPRSFARLCELCLVAALAAAGARDALAQATDAAEDPSALLSRAAAVLEEELALLPKAAPNRAGTPQFEEHRGRLIEVDGVGAHLLEKMLERGVQMSESLRRTLRRLPPPAPDSLPPPPHEYEAAIAELYRLAGQLPLAPEASSTMAVERLATRPGAPGVPVAWFAVTVVLSALLGTLLWRGRSAHGSDLMTIATTDALTGAANRHKLESDLRALASGPEGRVSVLMIDVDHFKQVNDRFGHPSGDEVLRQVGRTLTAHVRPGDVVYRYGGEEFCALLRDASASEAQVVAERLRQAILAAPMPIARPVTVSVGIAAGRSPSLPVVVQQADAALYEAKRSGRNRVERYSSSYSAA